MTRPTQVAYFGPDAKDAAVKRRIVSMQQAGLAVRAYTMRRQDDADHGWDNVDLGYVRHVAFVRRIGAILRAIWRLRGHRDALRAADLWVARNLDMMVVAYVAHRMSGARAPLVYECLDIHRLMTRGDFVGRLMRRAERGLVAGSVDVIVSSPGFLREYFHPHYGSALPATIIENRLPAGSIATPRPAPGTPPPGHDGRLTIGWYGVLRCPRSLALLRRVAGELPQRVQVVMHGYTKPEDLPDFDAQVAGIPNLRFEGRYRYPDDLERIYGGVDLVWAGDFHDAKFNSRWLLPNRLYEGGYFGVVPVAPADSETGRWIAERDVGFVLQEPLERTLPQFLATVTTQQIAEKRQRLLELPEQVFVQPPSEIRDYVGRLVPAAR